MSRIDVKNLGKSFRKTPTGGWARLFGRAKDNDTRWALRDVSFSVTSGERVGIIGENGAGKTTLLKLIAGVADPSAGTIAVEGNIHVVLSLQTQFQPELTGRENARHHFSLQGIPTADVIRQADAALEFSGVGGSADLAFSTYSDGMKARLAFACVTCMTPDILLIDETLSVGDANFVKPAQRRIRSLIESGAVVMVVSHDLAALEALCDRVLWLHQGRLVGDGPSREVLAEYRKFIATRDSKLAQMRFNRKHRDGGADLIEFHDLSLAPDAITTGAPLSLSTTLVPKTLLDGVKFECTLSRIDGLILFQREAPIPPQQLGPAARTRLSVKIPHLGLNEGRYVISLMARSSKGMLGQVTSILIVKRSFNDTDQPLWYLAPP